MRLRRRRAIAGKILARGIPADQRGVAALEFAIVSTVYLMMLMGLLEMEFSFYIQNVLSFAVENTGRQIEIGTPAYQGLVEPILPPHTGSGTGNSSTALGTYFCNLLAGLDCNQVALMMGTLAASGASANYYSAQIGQLPVSGGTMSYPSTTNCTGSPYEFMYMQAVYEGPVFVGHLIPSWPVKGKISTGYVHPINAGSAWVNENFTVTTPAAC
jgi:hypothetical protein